MASLWALECLVAVADTGSITQAAQLLHSSQPAVSHQLAALERETLTALLRREPRGVKLTAADHAAVADARRAIEAAASAMQSARAVGEAAGARCGWPVRRVLPCRCPLRSSGTGTAGIRR